MWIVPQTPNLQESVRLAQTVPAAIVKWISHEATNLLLPVRVGLAAPVECGVAETREVVILEF